MEKLYCPQHIENSVQQHWDTNQTFCTVLNKHKEKYYCLSMMPYPSGNLHMGHVRNYTIGDVISRYQRMLGKNVLQPMGWDAFGLPAEQAAMTNHIKPSQWTYTNIRYMKNQLQSLGFAYDWNREIVTCHPKYYRWEQWFFTILYKKGLVYRKTALVNWCPYHETVLANEQVINNCCWRCQTTVQYKKLPQWFIKITDYADQLLNGLDQLDQWPEQVKVMQRNWIGREERINVFFKIAHSNYDHITIHATRLDTFMGITYLTVSTNHPIALELAQNDINLFNFIKQNNNQIPIRFDKNNPKNYVKKGAFAKIYAIHPITQKKLPIWISNIIDRIKFNDTEAIGSCPAHNQCDWEFARQYDLPILPVIKQIDGSQPDITKKAMIDPGILFNSDPFNTLTSSQASKIITKTLIDQGSAKITVSYNLKDWGVSRQRYWGVPIPMITLKDGSIKPLPTNQLPVVLPENIYLDTNIKNPLKKNFDWIHTIYKNEIAFRETDTFDTFMESSWYYARYTCPNYNKGMLNPKIANYWLPVDQYIGGIEHATMHLMYFRFYHKLMRDEGLVCSNEPAIRLLCQGMILADSFYYLSKNGQKNWVSPTQAIIKRDAIGNIMKANDLYGNNLIYAGMCKMSKSKNNGIDPNTVIQKYGADAVRFFIMFAAPAHASLEWKESGIEGALRFLKRLWNITYQHIQNGPLIKVKLNNLNDNQKYIRFNIHKTIIKVTDDIDRRQSFNTALASIMSLINKLYRVPTIDNQDRIILQEALLVVVQLLYPFTPHISFVLWKALGGKQEIDDVKWPIADTQALKYEKIYIIIQINGKTRKKIKVSLNTNQNTIYALAKKAISSDKLFIKKNIDNIIYIPNKIINFLIK